MEALFTAFGIEWKLLLAQGVNFGVLILGLTYLLYKPVLKMLREREAVIAKGVEDAEESARIRATIESEQTAILKRAEMNAGDIVGRAEEEGKSKRAEILENAKNRSEALIREAELQAKELERQTLAQSEKEIARTAILAAEKILNKS